MTDGRGVRERLAGRGPKRPAPEWIGVVHHVNQEYMRQLQTSVKEPRKINAEKVAQMASI